VSIIQFYQRLAGLPSLFYVLEAINGGDSPIDQRTLNRQVDSEFGPRHSAGGG
jgi:hypothetical protein